MTSRDIFVAMWEMRWSSCTPAPHAHEDVSMPPKASRERPAGENRRSGRGLEDQFQPANFDSNTGKSLGTVHQRLLQTDRGAPIIQDEGTSSIGELSMSEAYVVTGTLTDERTVVLDEAVPVTPSRVRVVVEPLVAIEKPRTYQDVMDSIRERQHQRGHQRPTRASVDTALEAERESWGE